MKKNWPILALILVLILAYEVFVLRPYNKKSAPPAAPVATQSSQATTPAAAGTAGASVEAGAPAAEKLDYKVSSPVQKTLALGDEMSVRVHEDGRLSKLLFNKYFVRETKEKQSVELISNGLQWFSSNPALNECLNSLRASPSNSLLFQSAQGGLRCQIEYVFGASKKDVISARVSVEGLKDWQGQLILSLVDDLGKGTELDKKTLDFRLDGEVQHLKQKDLFTTNKYTGAKDWIAWGDKYFAVIFLPQGKFQPDLSHKQNGENEAHLELAYPLVSNNGSAQQYELNLYFGTKEISALKELRPDLVEAVDMGFFAPVGRFMLWCLKKLNLLFHNFGWSIIALTLLVRVLFWPLNKKVFESGQRMKDIQPKMEAIKKKYGNDRSKMEQMNREVMALYKNEKVNPMGSCLPMLAQLPIFLGLYGALNHAVDLYQAPWMLWIQDLSSKDPFYILPFLWTVSLILTAFITPQPTNTQPGMPDMRKIMFVMYIVFGFLSKDWPAGLTLYLFVSNLVGIAQQFVFKKHQTKVQTVQEGA
jgi:YidC/Oxa1 family membrane protein insertase